METFAAIAARRAVKKFDPEHRLAPDEIERLMEAVVLSPTAFNIQNWRFVVISDPLIKQEIRRHGWDQPQFTDCSLLVIVCGDRQAFRQQPERYWATAPAEMREAVVGMITRYYGTSQSVRRDENLRSGGLAAQTLMLAASAMGYDSCPMTGFQFDEVARIIGLPADHDIVMAVAVGRALAPARPRGGQLPWREVVHFDRFGT